MIFIKLLKRKQKDNLLNKQTLSTKEWPDHIITLNKIKFNEFIQKYPLSIVDFWSP